MGRFLSNLILALAASLLLCLSLAAMVFTNQIIGLLGRHISEGPQRELTVRLTRIIMPAQLLFYWGAFLMAVQYANHRFFLPALAPLFYNLGIIAWRVGRSIRTLALPVLPGAFSLAPLMGNVLIQLPELYGLECGSDLYFTYPIRTLKLMWCLLFLLLSASE